MTDASSTPERPLAEPWEVRLPEQPRPKLTAAEALTVVEGMTPQDCRSYAAFMTGLDPNTIAIWARATHRAGAGLPATDVR